MSWKIGSWQDFLKKKACRYILQHYLGQFLKQKLSLDQLSLDLYNGTGKITGLDLDVQAINEDLLALGVPVELVDGFVDCISVSIPWSALIQDNTKLEVSGLELTLQPKQREDTGMMAGEMFSSMQSSMTTSLQLAKECLESESESSKKSEPIEGVQKFASMIDSVLSKIKVSLTDTVIRLEHKPEHCDRGVALEIRIKRIEYFDDMATATDGTSVDGKFEAAAIVQKNLHIEGVQLYYDEITARRSPSRSRSSSEGSTSQMFQSVRSTASGGSMYQSMSKSGGDNSPPVLPESNPIQVASISGRQEIKLRTKQNDTLHGPKLEIVCQFGGLHVLLSPRQLHGMLELVSTLNSTDVAAGDSGYRSRSKNRPMDPFDEERVQYELQHQLQSGRIQSNNLASLQMQEYSLEQDEGEFLSLARPGGSDMESSYSSNYSGVSTRTNSTTPSGTSVNRQNSRANKDIFSPPKYHEDPTAELSHYHVRVAFFSVTLFHNNPAPSADNPDKTSINVLKDIANQYFQRVAGVTVAGVSDLKEVRKQMTGLISHDHLRVLGRPLTLECSQKSALKQVCTTLSVSVGIGELVETLFCNKDQKTITVYNEILTFSKDGSDLRKSAMYSSMQGTKPCIHMQLTTYARNKRSSRPGSMPRMDINVGLGELQMELDVTLVDRINTLITPEKLATTNPLAGVSMYHTVGQQFYSISETLNEGSSGNEQEVVVEISSPLACINVRFPIPDLRQDSHLDKSWYQRNLRDDVLAIELKDALVRTSFVTGQDLEEVQISSSEINGYFKYKMSDVGHHFAHVVGEGEGFNNPTITLSFCNKTRSVLDDDSFTDDTMPVDSLNGACSELGKAEPSPFSSRRHMHDKHQEAGSSKDDHTEQMVLPADRDEVREFMDRSVSNTKMEVKIVLPNACLFLPDKHFFEVLYNRLNNDILLWEPSAPAPVTVSHDYYSSTQNAQSLNVYNQLLHTGEQFGMAKSGLQLDSDSDTDTESMNHYSIHDSRYPRQRKTPRQQQSKMCLSLTIGRGRLTAFLESKDSSGTLQSDAHGEALLQLSDFLLFTVSSHNGDPNLQYLNILANRADLYHCANLPNDNFGPPRINCNEISEPVPDHLQPNHVIYRTESGVLVNSREPIGCGQSSQDMVAVALKIKLDTCTSKRDLISDETVKEFLVSVGLRGATMRHKMSPPYQNVFTQGITRLKLTGKWSQNLRQSISEMGRPLYSIIAPDTSLRLMDFLDVRDYPIPGYVDPKVLTELHVHLWTCAIDYRPLYLPLKTVILAESFTISSNIVAESAISVLRFVLDDGSLFISNRIKSQRTDLKKDYVCVVDIGRLELLLRSNTGNNQHHPKTELRASSNLVNIRTCADSCLALIDLIKYVASDGDLLPSTTDSQSDDQTRIEADINSLPEEEKEVLAESPPLTKSSEDHVHNLMFDAMQESQDSDSSSSEHDSPDVPQTTLKQTEVFFVPVSGPDGTGSPSLREPIVITQNVDSVTSSVTSSVLSGGGDYGSDDDEVNSDDFCMIDDAAWGKAPKDGQPTIRLFTEAAIEIKDNYFSKPVGRTDLLKAPENFPLAESRYTLRELTLVWHIYGGSDLGDTSVVRDGETAETNRDGMSVSYHKGSPTDRWSGHAGGREMPLIPRETLQTRGGPGRDTCKCMEVQLSKVRLAHEMYPRHKEQASRQVLLISDIEIRDKLKSSLMNKFLYQYYSDDLPKQTYANMVHIRAEHRRPDVMSKEPEEECALKVSLRPIRLNIDQDTLFFLKTFFGELSGQDEEVVSPGEMGGASQNKNTLTPPLPVMSVKKDTPLQATTEPQDLLMQFEEMTQDLQASLRGSLGSSNHSDHDSTMKTSASSSGTVTSDTVRAGGKVFFKSFIFSPDVPIRLDYHGKFDREHGALAGLGGLVSLNRSELKLKSLSCKNGLLGSEKVLMYCAEKWVEDIKVNQLPTILGGIGPLHAFVQLAHGVKDLFWLPVEQYRKDGRIIRGFQRGATSFSMSTAMSLLELTNRVVQGVQWCAELTFDMVSPGPRRRGYYPRQPADLREGVSNAYIVLREGFSETASDMVDAATKEHDTKGMMGAVGGVLRQIPPTIVHPLIIVPEAAANVIGGLKSQLKPDAKKEDEDKWKEEIID